MYIKDATVFVVPLPDESEKSRLYGVFILCTLGQDAFDNHRTVFSIEERSSNFGELIHVKVKKPSFFQKSDIPNYQDKKSPMYYISDAVRKSFFGSSSPGVSLIKPYTFMILNQKPDDKKWTIIKPTDENFFQSTGFIKIFSIVLDGTNSRFFLKYVNPEYKDIINEKITSTDLTCDKYNYLMSAHIRKLVTNFQFKNDYR